MQKSNIDIIYDVIDKSMDIIYYANAKSYFDLYFETINNILNGELSEEYDDLTNKALLQEYEKLNEIDFAPDDIRKALQLIIMRGFKELDMKQDVTPDTLGYLIGYLITRLAGDKKEISILDPMCGVGNLLFSLDNHINLNNTLYAIDNDRFKIDLCKSIADMMNTNVNLYYQDTMSIHLKNMDFVVCDIECNTIDGKYIAYDVILNHMQSLLLNGYMISIVDNDFFDYDKDGSFKKKLMKDNHIYGIIELPDDFFIQKPKSIVIFKHTEGENKNCLMVKLPSFNDVNAFNSTISQIEAWFLKNKD